MKSFKQWHEERVIEENKALLAASLLGAAAAAPEIQAAPPRVIQAGIKLTDSQSPNLKAIGRHLNNKMMDATIQGKTLIVQKQGQTVRIPMEDNQLSHIIEALKQAYKKLGVDGEFSVSDVKGFRGSVMPSVPHQFDTSSPYGVKPHTFRGGSDAARAAHERGQIGSYK